MLNSLSGIALIILGAILIDLVIQIMSDYLNISALNDRVPDEFSGIYDSNTYKTSQHYLKTNTKFGFISSLFSTSVTLTFWFSGGFSYLDQAINRYQFSTVITGLLFIGTLLLFKFIISLPFSIYSTFVIEEKFGFNKTTLKVYLSDLVKSAILSIILGGLILSAILLFFEQFKENAWWMCWLLVTLFSITMQFLFPTLIMPLFNKFTPLEDGELKEAVMSYARSIQFSLTNIFVMDGSKRSSKSNAFFTGFGKNKRIVLFDTLINDQTTDELIAILAHEMGHYKKKHIIKMLISGIIQTGIVFYLLSICISYQELFDAFFVAGTPVYAGLIFFGMLYSPIDFFTGLIFQAISRKHEYQADRFAAETTGTSINLVSALKKLSVNNLSNLTPHPVYVFLNYSHPPVLERIKALKSL